MTAEQGFDLHPLAAQDITEIWETLEGRSGPELRSPASPESALKARNPLAERWNAQAQRATPSLAALLTC